MGIELPTELADVAAQAGVRWPEADEEAMRHAARAWRDAGAELHSVTAVADGAAGTALAGVQGATGDAARQHWESFVRPGSGHLSTTTAGCAAAAERLEHAADQVGAAKVEIVRNLVGLAKNTDVAELAASAGDPTALAELGDLRRSTAASVAQVHETLSHAVRQDTGVRVPDTSALVGKAVLHPQLPLGGSSGVDGLLGDAPRSVTGSGEHGPLHDVVGTVDRTLGGGPGGHGPLGGVGDTVDRTLGGSGGHGPIGGVADTVDRTLGGGPGGHGPVSGVAGTVDRTLGGSSGHGPLGGVADTVDRALGGHGLAGTADRALGDVTGTAGHGFGPSGDLAGQLPPGRPDLPGHGHLGDIGPRGGDPATPTDLGPPGPPGQHGHYGTGPDHPGWSVADGHTGPVRIDPRPEDTGPISIGDDGRPLPPEPSGTVQQSSAAVLDGPRAAYPADAAAPPPAQPGAAASQGSPFGGQFGGASAGPGGAAGTAIPGQRADFARPDPARADVARSEQARPDAYRPDSARAGLGRPDAGRADAAFGSDSRARQADAARAENREPARPARPDPTGVDAGRTDSAVQRAHGAARQSVIALFLVHMFPIGHLPVPVNRPARQLPPPAAELDYAAGLRFPPADHPDSALVHDGGALANVTSGDPATIRAGRPLTRTDPRLAALLAGYDPLGGGHERDWDRRFQVRAARPHSAAPPEYAWPPAELSPEGGTERGEPVTLPPGAELDRFGTAEGRVLADAGAPFAGRSLPPSHADGGYRRYRVTEPLPAWRAVSAPWFAQPGGATRYRTGYPVTDLVALGYLADITHELGERS